MTDVSKIPTEGVALSQWVAGRIVLLAQALDLHGADKPTATDAMVLAAAAASMECRGPRWLVTELRRLADSIETSADKIEGAMSRVAN